MMEAIPMSDVVREYKCRKCGAAMSVHLSAADERRLDGRLFNIELAELCDDCWNNGGRRMRR